MSITDDLQITTGPTFTVGEQIRVHDTRFPHGLRSATISRVIKDPEGNVSYAVRLGLGGEQLVDAVCTHGQDTGRTSATCPTCAS